ncbi:MAG: diphthine--ammonia ligase [Candidatus Aenigmarchaeota archaeon]|nr:diphthine--ammonia ligase [Candidatus Aenigmarchaeota archaeon]
MRAAVLFSGGKDSALAAYEARQAGLEIRYLVSIMPESNESYMFHHPNIELTRVQAGLMGIPIITRATRGEKEVELLDLELALQSIRKGIDSVVSGAVASEYQKKRVDMVCGKLGLRSHAPLWHRDPLGLWRSCLDNGFRVMITAVACDGLDRRWLGKVIDEEGLAKLRKLSERHRFHLGGEGGEFETLVIDCPLFKKGMKIERKGIEWDEKTNSGMLAVIGVE